MGEKDLAEMTLEGHPDVFADMINTLAFGGRRIIKPEELSDATPSSVYKIGGKTHGQSRDVAKFWHSGVLRIASIGLENQTDIDATMPIRAMSYDAADYKRQLEENEARHKQELPKLPYYPVVTFVLYYGDKREWRHPLSLSSMMDIHPCLEPFVCDYRLNVINVAYLDDETIDGFESDFGTIARLLSNYRRGIADGSDLTRPLIHVRETLGLVTALTGSDDLERSYTEEGKRLTTLAEYLKGFETRAAERGIAIGEARGVAIGEARGVAIGEARGRAQGRARGIIWSGRKYGATDAQIKADLVEQLNMSAVDAERAMLEFGA